MGERQNRWTPPAPAAPHKDDLSAVLPTGTGWTPVVHSTLGDSEATEVPAIGGRVTFSTALAALVSVSISVPRRDGGVDWLPGRDPEHPLARYGQSLSCAVRVASGRVDEVVQVATVFIESWRLSEDGGTVEVDAFGPLKRVEDAGFTVPQAVRSGGTFASELTRLFGGIAPVVIDAALVDRPAPSRMAWGDERLTAITELADAWPARIRTDAYGVVWVLPPLGAVPQPQVRLADGEGDTVSGAPVEDGREGIPNRVVARGEAISEDRPAVQGVAQIESGPMSVHGPYGVVTHYYSSPLLTNRPDCERAAMNRLNRLTARSRTRPVTLAPDPRFTLDLAAELQYDDAKPDWGWVNGWEMPLALGGGAMRVDVEVPH